MENELLKADKVLQFIAKHPLPSIPESAISDGVKSIKLIGWELNKILEQLEIDGYIKSSLYDNADGTGKTKYYSITFLGEKVSKLGGYTYLDIENQKIQTEKDRVEAYERRTEDMQKSSLNVNRMIAFGTSVAAVYYLIEIVKFVYSYYHQH